MSASIKVRSKTIFLNIVLLLVAGALVSFLAYGQPGQSQGEEAREASKNDKMAHDLEMARQDNSASLFFVEQLAEEGAVEAIPVLEEKFARMQVTQSKYPSFGAVDKARVASALVRLGDKKEIYWDYLVKQATLAVENDAPNPTSYDSKGKATYSPAFIAWVKAHKLGHPGVLDEYDYALPGPVLLLAATGDLRAVPVFRRGLLSPNYLIEAVSAQGLAQIGDEASVPLIIEACKKAPPHEAASIARYLVYFDDPEAQKAVDKYVPADQAKLYREERARKKKPLP